MYLLVISPLTTNPGPEEDWGLDCRQRPSALVTGSLFGFSFSSSTRTAVLIAYTGIDSLIESINAGDISRARLVDV